MDLCTSCLFFFLSRPKHIIFFYMLGFLLGLASLMMLLACDAVSTTYGVQETLLDQFSAIESNNMFTCLDTKKTIPGDKVNDDYCDCPDGSDEPGTAACSIFIKKARYPELWKFRCKNTGFKPQDIPHSRLNDGICDCCDGSDEYSGARMCPNICAEVQESEEKRLMEEERIRNAGILAKEIMIKKAQDNRIAEANRLVTELEEIKGLEFKIKEVDQKLEPLLLKEDEEKARLLTEYEESRQRWENESENRTLNASVQCVMWRQTTNCDPEGELTPVDDKDCLDTIEGGASGYCECMNTETNTTFKYGKACGHGSLQCSEVCVNGGVDAVNDEFNMDDGSSFVLPEAEALREEKNDLNTKIADLKLSVEDLEKRKDNTFGVEDILRSLSGECFTVDIQSYTYELCPFKDVHQFDKGTRNGPCMGRWKHFAESTYSLWASTSDFSHMVFDDGDRCWNGLTRKTDVHAVCGAENKLVQVEEPSMCKYTVVFHTPALCE